MKALEQFFHFCIVCWSLAGIGAINSALNFPPDEHQGIVYFIFFIVLGFIGNKISGTVYYGIRSYLSIILSIFFYLPIIIGLLYINQIFFSSFDNIINNWELEKNMGVLGFEPRFSRPQREVLTTRRYPHMLPLYIFNLPINTIITNYSFMPFQNMCSAIISNK